MDGVGILKKGGSRLFGLLTKQRKKMGRSRHCVGDLWGVKGYVGGVGEFLGDQKTRKQKGKG